jgi:hypothetical protein
MVLRKIAGWVNRHRRWTAALVAVAATLAGITYGRDVKEEPVGVGIVGVQHIGPDYNISEFYVDGYFGMNVGRGGGGGSGVCCVMLPKKWRPGLQVDVRWVVGDWSKEIPSELEVHNYRSITAEGIYRAIVPVEKYDEPEELYVHFFSHGRVRVVSNLYGSESTQHPILRGDPHAVDSATKGIRIAEVFSAEERAAADKEYEKHWKKYGDWR